MDWKCRTAVGNKAAKTISQSPGNQVNVTALLFTNIAVSSVTSSKQDLIGVLGHQGTLGMSLFRPLIS